MNIESRMLARTTEILKTVADIFPSLTVSNFAIGLINKDPSIIAAFARAVSSVMNLDHSDVMAYFSSAPGQKQLNDMSTMLQAEYDGHVLLRNMADSSLTGTGPMTGTGIIAAILGVAGAVGAIATAVDTGIKAFAPKPSNQSPPSPPSPAAPQASALPVPPRPQPQAAPQQSPPTSPSWIDDLQNVQGLDTSGLDDVMSDLSSLGLGDADQLTMAARVFGGRTKDLNPVIAALTATEEFMASEYLDPEDILRRNEQNVLTRLSDLENIWEGAQSAASVESEDDHGSLLEAILADLRNS